VAVVYRFDPDGRRKFFQPYNLLEREWKAPEVRPLYGEEQLTDTDQRVLLVEGEKCADALRGVGYVAVSGWGGSNGIGKTDLSALAGREVVIWPDADEPGEIYADNAAKLLLEIGATALVIPREAIATQLEEEPPKGWDVADALEQGWDRLAIGRLIEAAEPGHTYSYTLGREKQPYVTLGNSLGRSPQSPSWPEPDMSILLPSSNVPAFPTNVLGPFWSRWVTGAAASASAPVDYVAGTLLSTSSSLIGNALWASPWQGWKEPPVMWIALVGTPSSGKSPAMDPVLDLVRQLEAEMVPGFEEDLRQYETDLMTAKLTREKWQEDVREAANQSLPAPMMPEAAKEPLKPDQPRLRVADATVEALIRRLSSQPKGLLVTRDELAGWLESFDRYGKGGDRPFWLEAYGGRSYASERVKHDGTPQQIPYLSLAVLGGIQPDRLRSLLTKGDDDGLPARIVYFWPEKVPRRRPMAIGDSEAALRSLRRLSGLRMRLDEEATLRPEALPFNLDAMDLFEEWWKRQQDDEPEGLFGSWWGKCPGMVVRLSLNLQMLWWCSVDDPSVPEEISLEAVAAAIRVVDEYLKPMAERVFGEKAVSALHLRAVALAKEILGRQPQEIKLRDIYNSWNVPGLNEAIPAREAVHTLAECGWLMPEDKKTGPRGGRPSEVYLVNPRLFAMELAA